MVDVVQIPQDLNACEAEFIYVFEVFRVAREFMADPVGLAALYSVAVEGACGWERVGLLDAITGTTGVFVQLFRAPAPFDAQRTNQTLNATKDYTDFFGKLLGLTRTFLCPMPYDPKRAGAPDPDAALRGIMKRIDTAHDTPENVVLIDRFGVADQRLPDLIRAKQGFFIPRVTGVFGWQLVAAGLNLQNPDPNQPGLRSANEVTQIWALPDSNRLIKTMRAMTQSLEYRTEILPLLTSEQQELFEPRAAR